MKHSCELYGYEGGLKELSRELADLRYDAFGSFLAELSACVNHDAHKDEQRGRTQLAGKLSSAASNVNDAWTICKKHMVEDE